MSLQGEIKLSVTIEDEANKDLPSAVQLFRPIRQYVYGVLFSLAEARKKAERLAMRKNCLPECESCSLHGTVLLRFCIKCSSSFLNLRNQSLSLLISGELQRCPYLSPGDGVQAEGRRERFIKAVSAFT